MADAISNAVIKYRDDFYKNLSTSNLINNQDTGIVYYGVQIAASKNSLDPNPNNFNGLEPIHKLKYGSYFKYYFSKSKSYKQIQKEKRKAKKKGFNSAFIVAFKGDKQIKLSEVLDK